MIWSATINGYSYESWSRYIAFHRWTETINLCNTLMRLPLSKKE